MKQVKLYNIKGELQTFTIRDSDELSENRCPRCGAFAIWSSPDWGSYSWCVVCGLESHEFFNLEENVGCIERNIKRLKEELEFSEDLLKVINKKVPTIKKNSQLKFEDCIVEQE